MNTKKEQISKAIDIVIAILVPVVWIYSLFRNASSVTLEASGLGGLKFFTIQSNLLAGIASSIFLFVEHSKEMDAGAPTRLKRAFLLKLVAAVAVAITFLTVLLFLGPLYGYASMYTRSSFFFHLLIPLLAMINICISRPEIQIERRELPLSLLPVLVYGTFYILNNLINGIGTWPDTNDWYGFLLWGYPVGFLIFAILMLLSLIIAIVFRVIRSALSKS